MSLDRSIQASLSAINDKRIARAVQQAFDKSMAAATVTALGTSSQANSAPILAAVNAIVTSVASTKGVRLPNAALGDPGIWLINTNATYDVLVYPDTGGIINALSANAAYTLPAAQATFMVPIGSGQWYAGIVGATSAQIAYLTGAVAGTGAASKVAVLDAGEDYVWPATGILTYGVLKDPAGTTLLATSAELNRSSDVSTRVVDCTASTLAVTEAAHDGKTITLNRAAGIAVTLPVASAGLKFRFVVGTTFTGAASIKSVSGADIMIGHALMGNNSDNTVVDWPAVAADTFDTIDLLGTSNSTGGMAGQVITIEGLAANLWLVEIRGDAAGTEATPFANTVA